MLDASDADLLTRYPPDSIYTVSAAEAGAPNAGFLVARLDGTAVGCGALVPLDGDVAEIKRMFVDVRARGRGVARKLVRALETLASDRGFACIRLETGPRSPEAIGLYESCGYSKIPNYGEYVGDDLSICYEKRLDDTVPP